MYIWLQLCNTVWWWLFGAAETFSC